jgi:enoyl-CoA hydratase/carnithine racemase
MEMILSGERIDAEHALRIGLVNRVFAQQDLLPKTLEYAEMLSKRAPLAHRFAKNTMRRIATLPLQEALRAEVRSFYELGRTEDLAEGTTSFRERRDADFKGR